MGYRRLSITLTTWRGKRAVKMVRQVSASVTTELLVVDDILTETLDMPIRLRFIFMNIIAHKVWKHFSAKLFTFDFSQCCLCLVILVAMWMMWIRMLSFLARTRS